jgi:hypothetical protein
MPMAGALPPEVADVEIKMVLFMPRDAASVPVSWRLSVTASMIFSCPGAAGEHLFSSRS